MNKVPVIKKPHKREAFYCPNYYSNFNTDIL